MIAAPDDAWFQFLGRLHPVVLHLPIGLWIGVAALEYGGMVVRRNAPRATVAVLAWFAALGAVVAVVTGWIWALEPGYQTGAVDRHRWFGVAVAGTGLLAAGFATLRERTAFRLLLLPVLGTLLFAGHLGSEMTHGRNFLFEPFDEERAPAGPGIEVPEPPGPTAGGQAGEGNPDAPAAGDPATPDPALAGSPASGAGAALPDAGAAPAAWTFAGHVLPLLAERCGNCHGEEKQKGELALHTREHIERGGEYGPVLVADDPMQSPLLQRLLLPIDHEDHMPPEGKPQPTAAEVALLQAWVAAGAPFDGTFAAAGTPPPVTPPVPPVVPGGSDDPAPPAPAPTEGGAVGPVVPAGEPAPPPPAPPDVPPKEPAKEPPKEPPGPGGATDPGRDAAMAALAARHVHVAPVADGDGGLWIDFAPVARSIDAEAVESLLAPVAADVVRLGLSRAEVGDETMALCARMPRLQELDLRGTLVTTAGLAALRELPDLRELVLARTRLDDGAVAVLESCAALREVWLWDAGVSADGIARLRARPDLRVDDGALPATDPLETEPEPHFENTLPPPGAEPQTPAVLAALRAVNDTCPVSGQPVDPRFVIVHGQRAVAFCCADCPKRFWAEPGRYAVAARPVGR